jgi:hypothetical protein
MMLITDVTHSLIYEDWEKGKARSCPKGLASRPLRGLDAAKAFLPLSKLRKKGKGERVECFVFITWLKLYIFPCVA